MVGASSDQKPASGSTNAAPKLQDLNSIFDKHREKLESVGGSKNSMIGGQMGGMLGFGFRGTIPKMPSFKVSEIHENSNLP